MKLAFGPWLPDQAALEAPAMAQVRNAIPTPTHWRPIRAPRALNRQALPGTARQALTVVRLLGGEQWQIVGADNKLWRIPDRKNPLIDLSRGGGSYTFGTSNRWRMSQFSDRLLATNLAEPIQNLDLRNAVQFQDLSPQAPRARYITTVRQQVVVGDVVDEDGADVYKLRWSGFDSEGFPDPTIWAYAAEAQTDYQRLHDVGAIRGLTGGETGTVLCEHGVVRMSYIGPPFVFRFDTVERSVGCLSDGSVVAYGTHTYFLSPEGWCRFNGAAVEPIGRERIDRWFFQDFTFGTEDRVWACADRTDGLIFWLYCGAGSSERPNRLLVYSPPLDQWGLAELEAEIIGPVLQLGLTLDDEEEFPDIGSDPRDLGDSRLWAETVTTGLVYGDQVQGFTGTSLPATFVTGEAALFDGRRAVLQRALPLHDGGAATLRLGLRETQGGRVTWTTAKDTGTDGWIRSRDTARFFTFRLELAGDWRQAQGLDLYGAKLGQR